MAVTSGYSAIVNAYIEILKAASGTRLIGLLPHHRPRAAQAIQAVQGDGGLTADQATLPNNSYALEGRVEHASPDVDADEVREAVERLLDHLPELIVSARAWLEPYGITFRA